MEMVFPRVAFQGVWEGVLKDQNGWDFSEESGVGKSSEWSSRSGEMLVEWRSSEQVENETPSMSPPYWDLMMGGGGPKPHDLYGKYTWKIEKFSQIIKRIAAMCLKSVATSGTGFK
ncbi:TNF receptor-associated factor homolog 1b-like [Hibiscus syriacus]|uniref:TNF receptor-associated factor homolog 1b-like n=1 Tax=Hibiscus syriacus TaxID=106335 RepID=UPI0019236CDE|nr:TNF receptor-associated factor homolog 1b-like [Hibiscus syriacus]